ncbi:PhzF family phenazine biosynthesis protein [soil metagenome]
MHRPFRLVDVFGQGAFTGNPLAVVAKADDLDTDSMQQITRWLNLSETAFLLRPTNLGADYRVRIFTLEREMPFAGHPTLGSCHAWLAGGGQPKDSTRVVQECGVGLISVRNTGDSLVFAAPPLIRSGPVDEGKLIEVAKILRINREMIVDAQWVDNGPGWVAVMLASAEAVLRLEPVRSHHQRIDIGVVGAHDPGAEAAFEIRALFSDHHGNLVEDPVTGSLNASVAQWLFSTGRVENAYVAAQGTRVGRDGRILIDRDETGQIWVGGQTRTMFSGQTEAW